MNKNPFCTSSQNIYTKDKTTTNHWVGHSIVKPIDVDELFNRRIIISKLGDILNDYYAIEASGIIEGQTETAVFFNVVKK